jgi:hypothetical protein
VGEEDPAFRIMRHANFADLPSVDPNLPDIEKMAEDLAKKDDKFKMQLDRLKNTTNAGEADELAAGLATDLEDDILALYMVPSHLFDDLDDDDQEARALMADTAIHRLFYIYFVRRVETAVRPIAGGSDKDQWLVPRMRMLDFPPKDGQ